MPPSAPTSPAPLTLEQVKEQFSNWRSTRTKLGKIPHALWEAVTYLIKEQGYTPRQVAMELGLNQQQLQFKVGYQVKHNQTFSTAPDFINVSLPPVSSSSSQAPSLEQKVWYPCVNSVELTRSDGTVLKVSGLDYKTLSSLIQSFLGK